MERGGVVFLNVDIKEDDRLIFERKVRIKKDRYTLSKKYIQPSIFILKQETTQVPIQILSTGKSLKVTHDEKFLIIFVQTLFT